MLLCANRGHFITGMHWDSRVKINCFILSVKLRSLNGHENLSPIITKVFESIKVEFK